jgi:diacylglycerol kinase (ATP)
MEPTPRRRVVVAINPSASSGRGRGVGDAVVDALRAAGHDVVPLREPTVEALAAAARAQVLTLPHALVVVGGDGVVNLGVQLVVGVPVALGIVPTGTGNDMARTLGIPHDDPEAATRLLVSLLDRPPLVVDAGRVTHDGGSTWFGCIVSAGFDAVVNERTNALRWPKGRRRYDLALLIELLRLRPLSYRLELDGDSREVRGTLVTVGNGRSFGGGMTVLPDARLDDGLLDVLIVERLGRLQFLRLFLKVAKGTHLADPRVHVHRVRKVVIESGDGIVAYADGERVGPLPVTVEAAPGVLHVIAPAASASA